MEQRPRFRPDPFKAENFYYNEEHDYCVCPMEQKMRRIENRRVKIASGYVSESARYRAVRREGCPLRCLCFKAKGGQDDRIEPQAQEIQAKSQRVALLRERAETQGTKMRRTGSRVRADKIQHELQTFPPFWEGQGPYGLLLSCHCLQYKKDVCNNDKSRHGSFPFLFAFQQVSKNWTQVSKNWTLCGVK